MIATLVWDSNLHTPTAHSWIWVVQMGHVFRLVGEISTQKEKADCVRTKMLTDHKTLSKGHESVFVYREKASFVIDIDSHQMRGKTNALLW